MSLGYDYSTHSGGSRAAQRGDKTTGKTDEAESER